MLSSILRSATSQVATKEIEFVGSKKYSIAGTTANSFFNADGLTGGIDTSPSVGDLVVVVYGVSTSGPSTLFLSLNTTSSSVEYSNSITRNAQDVYDANLQILMYKISSGNPTLDLIGGTGSNSFAATMAIFVFRNADIHSLNETPEKTVFASGSNTLIINPPPVTSDNAGSFVVSGGVGAGSAAVTYAPNPSSFTLQHIFSQTDTYSSSMSVGYKKDVFGVYDPSAFTLSSGLSSIDTSWCSVSLIIIPEV